MDYSYKLDIFEGPLDLLLHLIEKQQIDIYDIPIVDITTQYIEFLDNWDKFDIEYSSEFLVMAATLLHIKSKMLLPTKESLEDDEDPRDELVKQIVEYKFIKELANILEDKYRQEDAFFPRLAELSQIGTKAEINLIDISLMDIFNQVINNKNFNEDDFIEEVKISKEVFTIEDAANKLLEKLDAEMCLSFKRYLAEINNREFLVNTFLAILELLKQKTIDIICNKDDFIMLRGETND